MINVNCQQTPTRCYYFATEKETQDFALRLAPHVVSPLVMTFQGEIGMGKTTFIRALLRALGVTEAVKSPTFSLVEHYELPNIECIFHHVDLYRIHDETELEYIGFRDLFTSNAVSCIEWPEKAPSSLESVDIAFILTQQGNGRQMVIEAKSACGAKLIGHLC